MLAEALAYRHAHKGLQIYVWVILDNHFRVIVATDELSRIMAAT